MIRNDIDDDWMLHDYYAHDLLSIYCIFFYVPYTLLIYLLDLVL